MFTGPRLCKLIDVFVALYMRLLRRIFLCCFWGAAVAFTFRAWLPLDVGLFPKYEPGVALVLDKMDDAAQWYQSFGRRLKTTTYLGTVSQTIAARQFSGQAVVFGRWSMPATAAVRAALARVTARIDPLLIVPVAEQEQLLRWAPGKVGYQSVVVLVCHEGRVESVGIRDSNRDLSFGAP